MKQTENNKRDQKSWLFNENLRLENMRSELQRASTMLRSEADSLKAQQQRLAEQQQQFQQEKEEFQKEMKEWSARIREDKKKLEEEQGFFDKKFKILEMGFKQLDADRKMFESQKKAFAYSRKFEKEESAFHSFSEVTQISQETFFFRGVTHLLALKKRYKDLIKIYHPDNNNGDKTALQQINAEYDKLKNIITYQKKA